MFRDLLILHLKSIFTKETQDVSLSPILTTNIFTSSEFSGSPLSHPFKGVNVVTTLFTTKVRATKTRESCDLLQVESQKSVQNSLLGGFTPPICSEYVQVIIGSFTQFSG